jgi:ABC-type branched-subunit amino acid transport system substrate-binding protein
LVVAACGRDDDDDSAATTAPPATQATTPASTQPSTTGSGDTATTAGSGDTATTAAAAEGGPGTFGTLVDVCGPGDAKGATDVGVTDTEIHVATISDPGFPQAPGLNRELFDAADAFVGWCNAAGGINGRKLVVDKLDAKITDYKPQIDIACDAALSLVGDGGLGDAAGVDDRVSCGLPSFNGFTASPQAQDADLQWAVQPNMTDQFNPGPAMGLMEKTFPGVLQGYGSLVAGEGLANIQQRNDQGVGKLGGKAVYDGIFQSAGEASWAPFVQAISDNGVKSLFYIGDEYNLTALVQALKTADKFPEVLITSPNIYTQTFLKSAGEAGDGHVYIYSLSIPFEEASKYPVMQQYLDIMGKYAPDAPITHLGVTGWSAWLYFAQSAKACGSDLTRECLATQAKKVTSWDAGGIQVKTNPGENRISECAMLLQLTKDGYKRVAPAEGFDCDPSWIVPLPKFEG